MKKIAIVYSDYYKDVTNGLLTSALELCNELDYEITKYRVCGCMEIAYKVKQILQQNEFDAVAVYGCVIEGETFHNHLIQNNVYYFLMQLSLEHMCPVGFGILTVKNYEQALARSVGPKSRGREAIEAIKSIL
jgi:6,7-dimethyl-8-ribityllumazine synthase